ncbi:MAG: hypothetical protein J2P19_30635 [Pseudonocardia sp.]|nr:hypothetical protein [Pseudonocardia sp.]
MTQGARSGLPEADPSVPGCPTGYRHHFQVRGAGVGGTVHGLALRCPYCADRSVTEQLTEIVAARRRTMVGLAGLPSRTRADLAESGTLGEIYRGTITAVREAAGRCRDQTGIEPPHCLRTDPSADVGDGAVPGARAEAWAGRWLSSDRARAAAVLDAAADWAARLPR